MTKQRLQRWECPPSSPTGNENWSPPSGQTGQPIRMKLCRCIVLNEYYNFASGHIDRFRSGQGSKVKIAKITENENWSPPSGEMAEVIRMKFCMCIVLHAYYNFHSGHIDELCSGQGSKVNKCKTDFFQKFQNSLNDGKSSNSCSFVICDLQRTASSPKFMVVWSWQFTFATHLILYLVLKVKVKVSHPGQVTHSRQRACIVIFMEYNADLGLVALV
jgi:hypothetical protein